MHELNFEEQLVCKKVLSNGTRNVFELRGRLLKFSKTTLAHYSMLFLLMQRGKSHSPIKIMSRQWLHIPLLKSHKLGRDGRESYHGKKQGMKMENSIFKSLLTFLIYLERFYYYLWKLKLWFESKTVRELMQFLSLFRVEKLLRNTFRLLFVLSYLKV